jgi:hypothetical protein
MVVSRSIVLLILMIGLVQGDHLDDDYYYHDDGVGPKVGWSLYSFYWLLFPVGVWYFYKDGMKTEEEESESASDLESQQHKIVDDNDTEDGTWTDRNHHDDDDHPDQAKHVHQGKVQRYQRGVSESARQHSIMTYKGGAASKGHPAGITSFMTERLQLPQEVVDDALRPGETVLKQFDVYLPAKKLTTWYHFCWFVCTLGLYIFYLLWKWFKAWCVKLGWFSCCRIDKISFSRGKMVVTSKGRCITWEQNMYQEPSGESYNSYDISSKREVYSIQDVCEISHYFASPDGGCIRMICGPLVECIDKCCGTATFDCGIKVSFNAFDSTGSDPVITVRGGGYRNSLLSAMGWSLPSVAQNQVERSVIITSSELDLGSGTNVTDPCMVYDVLSELHEQISGLIKPRTCFHAAKSTNSARTDILVEGLRGVVVVNNHGDVQVPADLLPLDEDEHILDSQGYVYRINFMDVFACWATHGLSYVFDSIATTNGIDTALRRRRAVRTVVVLTNKRIATIYIEQRAGEIPSHFGGFAITVRSYFPGEIKNGHASFNGDGGEMSSTISCDAGVLEAVFRNRSPFCCVPINCIPETDVFDDDLNQMVYRMHSSADRELTMNINLAPFEEMDRRPDERTIEGSIGKFARDSVDALNADAASDTEFTIEEKKYLPLTKGELLMNRYRSGAPRYQPCCPTSCTFCCMPQSWRDRNCSPYHCTPTFGCCESPDVQGQPTCMGIFCFIGWVKTLTLGLRPYSSSDYSIITNKAVYHLSLKMSYPWSCSKNCFNETTQAFSWAWAPIRDLKGHALTVEASGKVPKNEFCCCCCTCPMTCCNCCKTFKPPGPSQYVICSISSFHFLVSLSPLLPVCLHFLTLYGTSLTIPLSLNQPPIDAPLLITGTRSKSPWKMVQVSSTAITSQTEITFWKAAAGLGWATTWPR